VDEDILFEPEEEFDLLLDPLTLGLDAGVGTDFVPRKHKPTPEELRRISDMMAVEAALAVQRAVYQEERIVTRKMAVDENKMLEEEIAGIIQRHLTAEAEVMASLLARKGKAAQVLARQQYRAGQDNREEDQRKAAINAQRNAALQRARASKAAKATAEQAKAEARRKTALKNLKKANKARRK